MDINNIIERSLERDALKYHEKLNFYVQKLAKFGFVFG